MCKETSVSHRYAQKELTRDEMYKETSTRTSDTELWYVFTFLHYIDCRSEDIVQAIDELHLCP